MEVPCVTQVNTSWHFIQLNSSSATHSRTRLLLQFSQSTPLFPTLLSLLCKIACKDAPCQDFHTNIPLKKCIMLFFVTGEYLANRFRGWRILLALHFIALPPFYWRNVSLHIISFYLSLTWQLPATFRLHCRKLLVLHPIWIHSSYLISNRESLS